MFNKSVRGTIGGWCPVRSPLESGIYLYVRAGTAIRTATGAVLTLPVGLFMNCPGKKRFTGVMALINRVRFGSGLLSFVIPDDDWYNSHAKYAG